jgi:rhodanese-related sulfurtransferase
MTTTSRSIDAVTLRERLETHDVRLLDVRTPAEYETAHVPGSWNVPLAQLREHRDELARHLDDEVVLVCRSGARAGQAEQALAGVGLPGLRVLEGGMTAWEASGAPVNRGRPTWELERQVRLVAGGLVASGVAGSALAPRLKWLAGAVGTGLVVAAVTDTCAMGAALSRLPWNRGAGDVDMREVLASLGDGR